MQPLDPLGNYTPDEVRAALTAARGTRRMAFRYDRLDELNRLIEPIDYVTAGSVSNNALADIKRTAKFTMLERGTINYLKDRIRPWARLRVDTPPTWQPGPVDARNICPNPAATGAGTGIGNPNSASDWIHSSGSVTPTPSPAGITSATSAYPNTGAIGTLKAFASVYNVDGLMNTGPARALSFAVYVNIESNVSLYSATGPTANFTIPANTWVRIANTMPAAIHSTLAAWRKDGAVNTGAERIYWTEIASGVDSFFYGDTVDGIYGPGFVYGWEGAPNASPSARRPLVLTPDPRPGFVEWPLGVFLLSTPQRVLSGGVIAREVEAYDQLLSLRDDRMVDRYSIAAGTKYTDAIGTIAFGYARSVIPSALTLPAGLEWEPGTTRHRILNDLLAAINYESAWFDESGVLICRPYQSPADRSPGYVYAADEASVIGDGIGQTLDLFDVANRWVLTVSEGDRPPLVSIYTNDDPASPTSTASRGRIITDFRDEEDAADQATLDAKAARLAFNASQVFEIVEFETMLMPMHSDADVVQLDIAALALSGKYSEHTWDMPLKAGARMSHKVRRVVTV